MQDLKLTDQCAGHEIAGHENAGHEVQQSSKLELSCIVRMKIVRLRHEIAGHENAGHEKAKQKTSIFSAVILINCNLAYAFST